MNALFARIVLLLSVAPAGATQPPAPWRTDLYVLHHLSARLESECNVPVSVEDRGDVPELQPLPAGGCSVDEIVARARASLGDSCSYGAWRRGEHAHMGPARRGDSGGCEPVQTPLDEPFPIAEGRWASCDVSFLDAGLHMSMFSCPAPGGYSVPADGITIRELLDQPLDQVAPDGRRWTWKVDVAPHGTRVWPSWAGGPYPGAKGDDFGPYHHSTWWWTDDPPERPTPQEQALYEQVSRDHGRGVMSDAEFEAFVLQWNRGIEARREARNAAKRAAAAP
jgi:hypothetical protein